MTVPPETKTVHSADLNAMGEQTQPAALSLLPDAALGALLRDLRAMKTREENLEMQKTLAQAIRRAAAEKRSRHSAAAAPGAPAPEPEVKLSKAEKAEEKRRKEAEKAERKRVREAEKAEHQSARALAKTERQAARQAEKTNKTGEKKPKAAKAVQA